MMVIVRSYGFGYDLRINIGMGERSLRMDSCAVLALMADHKLDAIVHKTVEHQPTFIRDGINPPYSSNKGVPTWNTFLVYAASMTVPSGFTTDNLPAGITFFGRPYSEPTLLKLAFAYEQVTHHRAPPKSTPALP
jgi:Asp-tRNA(Asn)/Glu-tRNA(Gln) amidotransferase A subunit family amidase